RHGGELPEFRQAPGVGIGGQRAAGMALLLPEPVEVVLAQSTLQIGAGVHAGGGVPLEEDVVAASRVVLATEEVVVAHFVQRRRPGIGGDVSADPPAA